MLKNNTDAFHVKSRNITASGIDLVVEVRTKTPGELVNAVDRVQGVDSVSLIEHEGEFRG